MFSSCRLGRLFGLTLVSGLALLAGACGEAGRPGANATREPAAPPVDPHEAEGAVIAAHGELVRAFQERDAQAVAALLDSAPGMLIFHPFVENRFDGYDEAREGLTRMFARLRSLEWTEVHQTLEIEGNVAWLTSQVLLQSPDLASPFVGRGTEIWIRRDERWRLTHGHWSQHARLAGSDTPY